jgi:capsular exopolysaccharide synthesis family protein
MEIRRYWLLFRKWYWLILIGMVVGGAAAYIYSLTLPTVYRSSTRVMISRVADPDQAEYLRSLGDRALTDTYQQLFTVNKVLEVLSDQLGYVVNRGQIQVNQVEDSNMLDISVTDAAPQKTAEIANALIEVFSKYSETMQTSRFTSSEQTLEAQIVQVEGQIQRLQDELIEGAEFDAELSAEQNQRNLEDLKAQLDKTESEIIRVEGVLEAFYPTPIPTSTPQTSFSPTATPVPIPTLAPAVMVEYKETQNTLEELQTLRNLYISTYANLLVLGKGNNPSGDVNRQIRQNQIETTLSLYQQIYTSLLNNYEQVRLARLRDIPNIIQIHPAVVPTKPSQPQPMRSAMMGMLIGGALMGAVAFVIEYMDDTIKIPEDVHYYLELPVVGMIGEMEQPKDQENEKEIQGVFTADHPLSVISEAFRNIRTNIELLSVDKPLETLLITSSGPSEGKSTIAVNLAAVMAQGGRKTILLDSDLRRPTVHNLLNLENRKGLSNIFNDHTQISDVIQSWGEPAIEVITSGPLPPNPNELIGSEQMKSFLEELKAQSNIVILDTSPTIVSDPIKLSTLVDGVIIIVEPGKTKIGAAQVMLEHFERANANVMGVVLNPIKRRSSFNYSQYQYYSKDYYKSKGYGHFKE